MFLSRSTQHWSPCILCIYTMCNRSTQLNTGFHLYVLFSTECFSKTLSDQIVYFIIKHLCTWHIVEIEPDITGPFISGSFIMCETQSHIPGLCQVEYCAEYWASQFSCPTLRVSQTFRFVGVFMLQSLHIYNVLNPVRYSGVMSRLLSIGASCSQNWSNPMRAASNCTMSTFLPKISPILIQNLIWTFPKFQSKNGRSRV